MSPETLKNYLDGWMTDTCSRYLHLLEAAGVVDQKKLAAKNDKILKARNAMLDEWAPLYASHLAKLLDQEEKKKGATGGEK